MIAGTALGEAGTAREQNRFSMLPYTHATTDTVCFAAEVRVRSHETGGRPDASINSGPYFSSS